MAIDKPQIEITRPQICEFHSNFTSEWTPLPSGDLLHSELENGPVEIVDLPIDSMVISPSVFCSRLPEEIPLFFNNPVDWNPEIPGLVNVNKKRWNITIFNGKTHYFYGNFQ